ncbi:MAG TPA: hypothetical protein PLQ12_07560 [Candidatus Defluviicoccus seviourii]|nr:hypothetical protein [Candidatus Defluviicoccus seviourii]
MSDKTPIESAIEENAQGVADTTNAAGERVRLHSLTEQIAADEYLARKATARSGRLPIRFVKIRPPGAV